MPDRPSVLVVDDEPTVRDLVVMALGDAGYPTGAAADGEEAISKLEHRPFGLAIIDIIMPNKDGIETIIEVRRRWPGCKIVAMSGGGRIRPEDFLHLAEQFGADATLSKPVTLSRVVETVRALLPDTEPTPQPH